VVAFLNFIDTTIILHHEKNDIDLGHQSSDFIWLLRK
jgi:hypothetical protein